MSGGLFDVAIVGGGPAGLSAAITLGRACRRVAVFDHGRPRNGAALAVHCFLGHEGISPQKLRAAGRREAEHYGVTFFDAKVTDVSRASKSPPLFRVSTAARDVTATFILLATGVVDHLPEVEGLADFYGRSVHHCPYCDGWEHVGERLAALGDGESGVALAVQLRTWSPAVALCTNGGEVDAAGRATLERNGVAVKTDKIVRIVGAAGALEGIELVGGEVLPCEGIFFSSGQGQRSCLIEKLGCERKEKGLATSNKAQCTSVDGVYVAGDADGDAQFAIVAAAEGAVAGVAIDAALRELEQEALQAQEATAGRAADGA